VQNGSRELVLNAGAGVWPGDVVAAAGPRFGLADGGGSATLRRTWLDTFDWRLYRAGLTLEQVSRAAMSELTLTARDGEVVAAAPLAAGRPGSRVSWPSLLSGLPVGPLRERLEPVVGVRALMPVARAVSKVREQRVLNSDGKTVARIAVDRMAVTYPSRAQAAPRLLLRPVRGYQAQASRLASALLAVPGVAEASLPVLDLALAAAGHYPAESAVRADIQLDADMPAAAALATVLTALLDTLEANVSGTIRDIDTEFLHDLRIAVRRTRSALKLAGGALPDRLARRFRPEFRWLGALTTPTRDLDGSLEEFPRMAAGLVAASPAELAPLLEHLAADRAAAQRQLARGLRSARFSRLAAQWREALAGVPASARSRPRAGQLAAGRIAHANQRVLAGGAAITPASPAASLHELRKRCKELRYLMEMFRSLHDPAEHWRAVRELKALQDCLGEFQDTDVQAARLRAFADQLMEEKVAPAATLLAMGEIAAGLTRRERKARGEFDERFRDFISPPSQDRIRALTAAAR
jgi:CHAD domain-containing protein